jgi:hypothetical protein
VGVSEIRFATSTGGFRAEQGKILVSIYVIAINLSDDATTFYRADFGLIDGGGEGHGGGLLEPREPEFDDCSIRPGGACEGWVTFEIWDREPVKQSLIFRWDPCLLFCGPFETPIEQ